MRTRHTARLVRLTALVCVLASASGFVQQHHHNVPHFCTCCCCCSALFSQSKGTTTRGNPTARLILETLASRFDFDKETWSKARNYIYKASSRLTVQQVEEVLAFLEETFPDNPSLVMSILSTCPRILRRSVENSLRPTCEFLKELYGGELFRVAISRNPHLLLTSGVSHGKPNQEMEGLLCTKVGLSTQSIARLKKSAPFLFQLTTARVDSVISYLSRLLEQGGYHDDDDDEAELQRILGKVVTARPHLMGLSVRENLEPRIEFLRKSCQLQDRQVATLIKTSSGILGLSVKDNLQPTLEFLRQIVSVKKADPHDDEDGIYNLRKCILGHPQLLALSLQNLKTKVAYFDAIDQHCGSDSENRGELSLAGRIAIRSPAVYSLSLQENTIPTVDFLSKVWGTSSPNNSPTIEKRVSFEESAIDPEQEGPSLASLLKEYPSVLTLSLEGNIQPTLNFFNRTGYTSLNSDWTLRSKEVLDGRRPLLIRGRYIAASLFYRLLPRWHYFLTVNGRQLADDDINASQGLPPLHLLVGATDRDFCEQMTFELADYLKFKEESVPRLKFSSQFDTWLKTGRPIDETVG